MTESLQFLKSLFEGVLTTSWQASLVVGFILVISWLLRNRMSSRLRHGLWLILLLKLMIPIMPPSPLSLFNWVPERPTIRVQTTMQEPTLVEVQSMDYPLNPSDLHVSEAPMSEPGLSADLPAMAATSKQPVAATKKPFSWETLIAGIWFLGCVFFLFQLGYQNWKFSKRVHQDGSMCSTSVQGLLRQLAGQMGLHHTPTLIETKIVSTPAVHKFLKPVIILPSGMSRSLSEDQLRHVFLHELAHIKRWDLLVHWVAHVLRAVHWFNPIIWFALARMRGDCEMATDALALRHVGEEHRQVYGETILDLIKHVNTSNRIPGLVGIVEGKKEITRRILSIRNFRNHPRLSKAAAFAAIVLSMVSLTSAVPKIDLAQEEPGTPSVQNKKATTVSRSADSVVCTIVDPDGAPVPNALVSFGVKGMRMFILFGKTDKDGRIEVPVEEFKPDLVIDADGFAPTLLGFDLDPSLAKRTYRLEKPGTITGKVFDEAGKPVEGAEVIPSDWHGYRTLVDRMIPEQRIITDGEGRFTWKEAPNHGRIAWTVFAKDLRAIRDQIEPVEGKLTFQMAKPDQVIGTVVDAETGEAIPEFKFSVGDQRRISSPVMNLYHKGEGVDGAFTVDILEPSSESYHVVTVTADGYALAQSPVFKDGDGILRFRFELQKANDIEFRVLQPDGQPASGATMVQRLEKAHDVWMTTPYMIDLNRILGEARTRTTDVTGYGGTTPLRGMKALVVAHEQGFAEIDLDALRSTSELHLSPWGRIEGTMFIGGKPFHEQTVRVERHRWDSFIVVMKTTTQSDGSFVFEGLPAGEYKVTRDHGTNLAVTDVVAGETTTLTVGKTGRILVGQAKVDMPSIGEVYWQREDYFLKTDLPIPADIKQPTEEEQRQGVVGIKRYLDRKQAFWDSDEGKAIKRTERSYAIRFNHDGSFRIEGVIPGRYILELQLKERHRVSSNRTLVSEIATARQTVVVPEEGVSSRERVIDLGEIDLLPIAGQEEAYRIDAQFTYEFFQNKQQGPIKLLIQGDNMRMDWVRQNVHAAMAVVGNEVYLLESVFPKDKDGKVAHHAYISNADEFPRGMAMAEAMYLIFTLGKLNERHQIARLQKSLVIKNHQISITQQVDKVASTKGIKRIQVFGRKNAKSSPLLRRLFRSKEYLCIQTEYLNEGAFEETENLKEVPLRFISFAAPSGSGKEGDEVFESFQFKIDKVEKVEISEENPLLPSLKSIESLNVTDLRFKGQQLPKSIFYSIVDATWPKRDAEIVKQTLERALK